MLCKYCKASEQHETWVCSITNASVLPQMCDNVGTPSGVALTPRSCFVPLPVQFISVVQKGWVCPPCLRQRELKYPETELATWCKECKGGDL